MAADDSRPMYGNWRAPRSTGVGSLSTIATGSIFACAIITIVASAIGGLLGGLLAAALCGLFLTALIAKDSHGTALTTRVATRVGWKRGRATGANLYRSGPLGRTPWGRFQLPGVLAASRMYEYHDSYGRPFAVLHMPSTGHYTVVIGTEPDGAALVDPRQVDDWVANWGGWLSSLAYEPGLQAASVTVETAPDSGARVRREVRLNEDPDAPPFARAVLDEIVDTYPQGSATVRAWVALTFGAAARKGGRRRRQDEIAQEIATRLPSLTARLLQTGAGAAHPLSANALCEVVRTAYDPDAARLFDDARAEGQRVELDWNDVGPAATEAAWDYYRHDSAVSVTWSMTNPPRGFVYSSVLESLLEPNDRMARKRVTLLYRPQEPGAAARLVETDLRNAETRTRTSTRPTHRMLSDQEQAASAAREEAQGAGLVNFGLLITATAADERDLPDMRAAVDSLALTARITARPVYGAQDAAFAAALPVGLIVAKHLVVPEETRRAL